MNVLVYAVVNAEALALLDYIRVGLSSAVGANGAVDIRYLGSNPGPDLLTWEGRL